MGLPLSVYGQVMPVIKAQPSSPDYLAALPACLAQVAHGGIRNFFIPYAYVDVEIMLEHGGDCSLRRQ